MPGFEQAGNDANRGVGILPVRNGSRKLCAIAASGWHSKNIAAHAHTSATCSPGEGTDLATDDQREGVEVDHGATIRTLWLALATSKARELARASAVNANERASIEPRACIAIFRRID